MAGRARYLVLRVRALASGPGTKAQFFWANGRQAMSEERSLYLPITADGVDRTILVDLWKTESSGFWKKRQRTLLLRFDPLDRPGSLRVSALALLPEGWSPPPLEPKPRTAELLLPSKRKRAVQVLERRFAGLEPGTRLTVLTEREASWLRRVLEEATRGAAITVQAIENHERGSRATIVGVQRARQVGVDVVVPVFNARKQTLRCLRSVLRHGEGDYRLVVIDDASTDPKLWPRLVDFARGEPRVVLLRNPKNLGFSGTVNRGIQGATSRDVLVLNSDTKVFAEFLPRLRAAAHADAKTGIACALSNNATICSVPEFCRDNPLPSGMTGKQMARLVRVTAKKERPELVTPVGFCMYLRRELIEDVGLFDAERYGRGFGEENDLGERAKMRGWRIRLASDVYVLHEGKASFGEQGRALESKNAGVLEKRHPGYHAAVADYIRKNPLSELQSNLKLHIQRGSHRAEAAPLELLHHSPFGDEIGGTEHVVRDLVRALRLPRVVFAYPAPSAIEVAEVIGGDLAAPLRYQFPLETPVPRFAQRHAEAEQTLERILDLFRIGIVHVHHPMNWPLSIARVLKDRRVPYVMTQHDCYAVCPTAHLLDVKTLEPCCPEHSGQPERVGACLGALCSELGIEPPVDAAKFLADHRAAFAQLLAGAQQVIFPSPSGQALLTRVHGLKSAKLRVLPHGYDPPRAAQAPAERTGPLRVALLGEVAYPSKGAQEYLSAIRATAGAPIEWHVFGNTDRFGFEQRLSELGANVVRHGPYRRAEIASLLERAAIDLGLLLPICPESFSLTLSELLSAGVPVVAARQGALVDRLEGRPYGVLVKDASAAAKILGSLAERTPRLRELQQAAREFRHPPVVAWAATHRELYARVVKGAPGSASKRLGGEELRELGARRLRTVPAESSVLTTRPASRYTGKWWYALAERIKPRVPESLRAFARRRLAADGLRATHRLRLPGPHALLGSELRIVKRYFGTTMLESLGNDPHLLLELPPVRPESIQAVSFNLWCSHSNAAFAQLYWRHKSDVEFTEEKSITIPLDARSGAWQEYVVRVDEQNLREAWHEGGEIVALRFDPINLPGLIGLGELALCTAPPRLTASSS
jgi:GT2 family glycosyltransferase/glycosyltransferase involved in cell wall biosynthesis